MVGYFRLIACLMILVTQNNASYAASSRPFYMGFTSWPYDSTQAASVQTDITIGARADIIAHHFDGGVPWTEAFYNLPFPREITDQWNAMRSNWNFAKSLNPSKTYKTYVAVTPLDFLRLGIAPYQGTTAYPAAIDFWKTVPLDSPVVSQAFCNYAVRAKEFFGADYLAIGVEVNMLLTFSASRWQQYKNLHRSVYQCVKARYPNLPVFASIQYANFLGLAPGSNVQQQLSELFQMAPYNDLVGFSVYPYGSDFAALLPTPSTPVPSNFFDLGIAFAKAIGKKIAITEGGYPSQPFGYGTSSFLYNQNTQANYLSFLFSRANQNDFEFVINWIAIDTEPFLKQITDPFFAMLAANFTYIGIRTVSGQDKLSSYLWWLVFAQPKR